MIIGPRATYNGVLRSDSSIRIDGVMESGLLETPANVILTEGAQVNAEIRARTVSIRGHFDGVIRADRAELLAGCHVRGLIFVKSFLLDDGATVVAQSAGALKVGDDTLLSVRPERIHINPASDTQSTRVSGTIRNITNFGIFVGLEEGIDGLVHVSDISWTEQIKHPGEKFKKGDTVEAVVLKIDIALAAAIPSIV